MAHVLERFIRTSLYLALYALVAGILSALILLTPIPDSLAIVLIIPISLVAAYYIMSGIKHLRSVQAFQETIDQDIVASESRHQAMLEHMTQGLILTDLSDNVEYINTYGTKLTGFKLEELHGKRIYETLLSEEEREAMRRKTRETATGKSNAYDMRIQRKNGKTAWVRINSAPLRDVNGKVMGAIHNLSDITEQKEALDALATSARHLRAILDNIPLVLFMVDREGVFTLSEGLGLRSIQLLPGQVDGQSIFDVFAGSPDVLSLVRRALHGEYVQAEIDLNGKIFEAFYSPLYDHETNIKGLIGVSIDITKRVSAEKDLLIRTKAIEYSATGIMISDANQPDLPLIYANRAMLDMTGYTLDEMVGRNCRYLQGDEHDQPEVDVIRHALTHGESCTVTLRNYRKNGEMFYNELSISPIENSNREITHFVGVSNDVTERIHAESALADARDQALEASRLKSEFLATMSHEIRTPMNGIIGMTELLMDSNLNPEQREFSKIVFDEAHHLLNIINTILDFSRIEANKLFLHEEVINLHDIVDGVGEAFASIARVKKLPLFIDLKPDVPIYVMGDALRIRQIIVNLVDNALKFTHDGEVLFRVDVDARTEASVAVNFIIKDTGIGLDADELDRLFEPFTQADGSTTRKYGGTGLGLTISKRLSELMNGKIEVESTVGGGSTFTATIPFKLPEMRSEFADQAEDSALPAFKVLIMTPWATQARILQEQLDSWGVHNHHTEHEMPAALQMLQEAAEPFNVIIVDVQSRDLSNPAFMKVHETLMSTPNLSVVALSDVTIDSLRKLSDSMDRIQVVNKPVKRTQLYRTLTTISEQPILQTIPATPIEEAQQSRMHRRILIVEDNPLNLEVTERQLEFLGYAAAGAENGKAALELLASDNRFDMILMDCQMPEMDGFEATRHIRKSERENGAHMTIVAMTANAMQGDREKCIAAGMDDYISKPVKLDVLRGVLEKWITDGD